MKMQQPVYKTDSPEPRLEYGMVSGMVEDCFLIRTSRREARALQALGCLVRPAVGDRVLLSTDEAGECWVLSVLSRKDGARATEVTLPGDVRLHAPQGELRLTSCSDVAIGADRGLHLASDSVSLSARKADLVVEKTRLLGRIFSAQVKKVHCVGRSMESVFHRLTQRLTDSFKFVAEHDEAQAGSARQIVEETLTVHSKNELHMAEEIVKLDADQVHLG
jgi:hypothetical protein